MWPILIGSTAAYALWKLLDKSSTPAPQGPNPVIPSTYKIGDTVMVNTSGLGLPRAMPDSADATAELVDPPQLLPAKIYGVNGSSYNARITTKGGLAYPQYWDGSDIAFKASIVDGYAKDSKYSAANQGLAF